MRTSSSPLAPRAAPLALLLLLSLGLGLAGCADRAQREARQTLEAWLQANVARKLDRVVALTSDAAFAAAAKHQHVPIAQLRKDMPALLALAPEKLEGFTIEGNGRKLGEGHYAFVVVERLVKQGRRREKREELHVLYEAQAWRVDPTRTQEPAAAAGR